MNRRISDLLTLEGDIYIVLSTPEIAKEFLSNAESEGITFEDGVLPTNRPASDVYRLYRNHANTYYENERIMEMKNNMNTEISYIERDGIFYPDLKVPEQTDYPIGKYGQMRLDFIKKHRRGTYTSLLVAFKLNAHLYEIDTEARRMVDRIITQLAKERIMCSFPYAR